ncbi:hypothetical protein DN730_03940 [Marinomonas piezotolerans]|uniref:Uncharacterized protein n=1 Tax=Marinomonas piezotolerans TaxID=2213058 RepID=A0A370UEI0_9GAMM|nr:hypothetical protein [Marinomonas piezotolerans]RDL46197.1 hypothetical protein DN730_03940 [Marinomonas piezotolerans]
MKERIQELADKSNLEVKEAERGFSVLSNGRQIRFFFKEDKLIEFLLDPELASVEQGSADDSELKEIPSADEIKKTIVERTTIEVREVVVTDVRMPFMSMVFFMVKWAIASIPAFLILGFIYTLIILILRGVF